MFIGLALGAAGPSLGTFFVRPQVQTCNVMLGVYCNVLLCVFDKTRVEYPSAVPPKVTGLE